MSGIKQLGAITYLDKNEINNSTILDITILTNDISQVYKTTETIAAAYKLSAYKDLKEQVFEELNQNVEKNNTTTYNLSDEYQNSQRSDYRTREFSL